MIGRLNHVGVATPSIEESVALYRDVLGASKIHDKFKMEEQGVYVCFVDLQNSQIELIEPINDKSPIAGFLKNNPAGGQHTSVLKSMICMRRATKWWPKELEFWVNLVSVHTARKLYLFTPKTWAAFWSN